MKNEELLLICYEIEDGLDAVAGFNKILSLLGENEIVVLDAPEVKHVGLLDVRKSECEADSSKAIEHTSGAALENRIEDGNPKQKLVNLQSYNKDKKRKEIIKKVIDTTKSF